MTNQAKKTEQEQAKNIPEEMKIEAETTKGSLENDAYQEAENQYSDSLEFDTGVIEKIVGITSRDVQGILAMKGSLLSDITQSFTSGDDITRGIHAEVDGKDVIIDMKVILEFGSSAPAIFADVRDKVHTRLREMTGLELRELNMRVVDVMTKKAYEEANKQSHSQAEQRTVQVQQEGRGYSPQENPGYY